jgi:hypothetical protein
VYKLNRCGEILSPSFCSRSWPLGGYSFGVGRHFHCQILAALLLPQRCRHMHGSPWSSHGLLYDHWKQPTQRVYSNPCDVSSSGHFLEPKCVGNLLSTLAGSVQLNVSQCFHIPFSLLLLGEYSKTDLSHFSSVTIVKARLIPSVYYLGTLEYGKH